MAEIISQQTVDGLPFKAEAITRWNEDSDLPKFLVALYNQPCVITGPDGVEHDSNYSDYGIYLFDGGLEKMTALAQELTESSVNVHHQNPEKIKKKKHDFMKDDQFGLAAKSIVAWEGIDSALLSESAFVSIYHTLEAGSDLDCSVTLLKSFHYKQAGYCLRAFIENATLPLYFSQNPDKYELWKKDGFNVPPFRRKKDGLLNQLASQKVLTSDLADKVGLIYGKLNAFVHSSVSGMIHSGHDSGEWRGLCFKLDEVHRWCGLVTECVEVGIHLAKIQTEIWLKTLNSKPDICAICHSENNFKSKQVKSAGKEPLFEFVCKKCGHKWYSTRRPK
jgi:hypothetical protein